MNKHIKDICKLLRYPDDLHKPIAMNDPRNVFPPVALMIGTIAYPLWLEHEFNRKLKLLLDHYKIQSQTPDAFANLSRRLIMDWIPGFRSVSKAESRGRPTKDDETRFVAREIDRLLAFDPKKTLGMACKEFQKKQNRKSSLKTVNPRSIERKYRQGKNLIKRELALIERVMQSPVITT